VIVDRASMKKEVRPEMRGGAGEVHITHLADGGSIINGRLLAELTLPAGASIGEHEHNGETEYYIILEGEGLVIDNGQDMPVKAGEVVVTGDGSSHSILNTGTTDLKMIAVIITY